MLIELNVKNNISQLIKQHIILFDSFKNVYLFGSMFKKSTVPNDIDILLIYSGDSNKIMYELNSIRSTLETVSGLSVDLIVLSIEEEKDTEFLKRIDPHYLKLK
ncbi:nucleotidyltransferase domain-containing protein [Listeria welshimeri]|uniref:nucleotidyltransferase domain-containing protein n=1 Tax=Listeria welshimeri TaxID=1643 RepID=UPI001887D951|nr:nucleotidyltransferase domain-containing protein [Listeria welshimeri]MBF2508699.1 nucleotidyltransferase domain-containing protein [Listeria welshimeri]MBF2696766.1 nucleotidyltransferase domain-containing protein [Listeria welshimeri]